MTTSFGRVDYGEDESRDPVISWAIIYWNLWNRKFSIAQLIIELWCPVGNMCGDFYFPSIPVIDKNPVKHLRLNLYFPSSRVPYSFHALQFRATVCFKKQKLKILSIRWMHSCWYCLFWLSRRYNWQQCRADDVRAKLGWRREHYQQPHLSLHRRHRGSSTTRGWLRILLLHPWALVTQLVNK